MEVAALPPLSPPAPTPPIFSLEASFDMRSGLNTVHGLQPVAVAVCVFYVVLLVMGRRYMTSRAAMTVRGPLVAWNVALAAFSAMGAVRTMPELVHGLRAHGLAHNICADTGYLEGVAGFWTFLFTLSKLVELGDTAFIVLRKQSLPFLHWYHHITVLLYCFFSYPQVVASGRWYMVMNYCIHSAMYTFFALKALRVPVPRSINVVITSFQILQMFVGLAVALGVGVLKAGGTHCTQTYSSIGVTVAMYVSYFVLFVQFFLQAYGGRPAQPRKIGGIFSSASANKAQGDGLGEGAEAVQNGKHEKAF